MHARHRVPTPTPLSFLLPGLSNTIFNYMYLINYSCLPQIVVHACACMYMAVAHMYMYMCMCMSSFPANFFVDCQGQCVVLMVIDETSA